MKKKPSSFRQPLLFPEAESPPGEIPPSDSPAPRLEAPAARELAATPLGPGDLVVAVDSHSLIYQVFHALPSMTSPDGREVGAVHGFLRDLADLQETWHPTYLICAFDASDITFRNQLFDQYKAHRESMPEDLRAQIPLILQAVETLDIPCLSVAGYEADDILATLATQAEAAGARCLLVTSDKDCRQLISDQVQMLNLRKSEVFGAEQLRQVWGIAPHQVVDFQAMVGDSVDNVPGIPQIGPKAAQQLLQEFGSLDAIYEQLERVTGGKRQETLRLHRDQAFLSRDLVRLKNDVPFASDWHKWRHRCPNASMLDALFRELGFRRLAERFNQLLATESPASKASSTTIDRRPYRCIVPDSLAIPAPTEEGPVLQHFTDFQRELTEFYERCTTEERWLAIDSETTSIQAREAEPVGYSLAWSVGSAAYLPVAGPETERILVKEEVHRFLQRWLEDPTIRKIGQNIKYDLIVLRGQGLAVSPIGMDTMVADYLLEPGGRNHNLDELAVRYLDHQTITIDTLIGSGKEQRSMATVPIDRVAIYAAEDVDIPMRLLPLLRQQLEAASLDDVYAEVELPLIEVLAEMEYNGITVDARTLSELGDKFAKRIEVLKEEIDLLAGERFNPDSPKQLAAILFEKLGLRVVKKTKTGASTDVEVLQELAHEHPLPAKIVEYRQATKLKGTYLDALPRLISNKTGRIHTSFRQDIAATGRLSSSDPNLQNIPVRTEEGRAIRSAFRPGPPQWLLLTADYSQIELRVLAHYCGDPSLKKAFAQDEDIHARVAAEVHGIPVEQVTSSMRRSAKAINFGILYGQSPFGLAKSLGISQKEAADFIDTYFERYRSIREFIVATLEACRRDGFVTTIAGRKRFLKGIRDFAKLNPQQQKSLLMPERMAVNTVIQGSAADLIKIAMIHVHRHLKRSPLQAKLLLQIHDELLFEVAPADIPALSHLVRQEMTSAVELDVPLKVDIKVGQDWSACEDLGDPSAIAFPTLD